MEPTGSGLPTESLASLHAAVAQMDRDQPQEGEQVSVVFLRNITIEGIEPFLKYFLYAEGIRPSIAFGGYGTTVQDVMGQGSLVARTDPDVIIVCLALEDLDPDFGMPRWQCNRVREELESVFEVLATRTRATIVVNTFVEPLYPDLGFQCAPDRSDSRTQVSSLNQFILEYVRAHAPRFCVTSWDRYMRLLGEDAGLDRRYGYLSRAPFRKAFLNLYAREISRVVCALKGRAKKCLVLDCDNTLWGGIVGEDGLDGIKLDLHEYPGKAYRDFQKTVLQLFERGVLVALCSRNNEADVFEVLERHPACLIKREHLAAWRINWQEKASNIRSLAEQLNIGLDALVFLDDDPVQCDMVRQMAPDVTVLQVPEKLHELPFLPLKDGLFDTLSTTDEDRTRTGMYRSEAKRVDSRRQFESVDDYLTSLETVARIHRARPGEFARLAQLTQKSNQFNVTTRRYSEQDIRSFAEGQDSAVYTVSVADKFGDLGLVGALIATRSGDTGRIDTFLMSCRALGRGVESAMVPSCLAALREAWSVERWNAEYIPTRKNGQVADLWLRNGFQETATDVDGRKTYSLDVRTHQWHMPTHLAVELGDHD
jgi:FkbH-like protein